MSGGALDPTRAGAWHSRVQLLVLHAVRLAGFVKDDGVVERAGLPASEVRSVLHLLEGHGLVQGFAFADTAGWILTDEGKLRDTELLLEDLDGSGARPVLERTVEDFDDLNARLVRVISEWQLQSLGTEASSDDTAELRLAGHQVVQELTEIEALLVDLMVDLVAELPRFGRYPQQFSDALQKARDGDLRWIAGVGLLSCHVVWAELHEDLLSSLGIDRSSSTGESGG